MSHTEDKKQKICEKILMLEKLVSIMNAYEEGEQIQARMSPKSEWMNLERPDWIGNPTDYRIAPPPPKVVFMNLYEEDIYNSKPILHANLEDALNNRDDYCLGTYRCEEITNA